MALFGHRRRRQLTFELFCLLAAVVSRLSLITPIHGFLCSKPKSRTAQRLSGGLSMSEASSSSSSKYKKVFVAGGSKGVGHSIVEKLSTRGTKVVALVRREESQKELNAMEGVTSILGDAFDQKDVENAMDGCDAAISTLGGMTGDKRIDYEGNNNVIESAGILGVQRILLLTSIGCGSSKMAAPPSVFEVLKDTLAEKEKAENILMDFYTNTNWSIIRPGGLVSEPMTGKAILTEDTTAIGSIHREDVADLVIKALDSLGTERKILSAIDPSLASQVAGEGKVILAFEL